MTNIRLHDLHVDSGEVPFFAGRIDTMDEYIQTPEPDRHTFHELLWIEEGEGWHHIDFTRYEIKANTFFYVAPGQIHFWQVPRRSRGNVLIFTDELLHLSGISELASDADLTTVREMPPALYLAEVQSRQMGEHFELAREEYVARRTGWRTLVRALAQLILVQSWRYLVAGQERLPQKSSQVLAEQFKVLIESNYIQHHSVQDYARMLAVSPGYLTEAVHEATGLPAGDVIRRRILLEAKRMLIHSNETVEAISMHLGFKNASYFGRFFRRESNATPEGFRREYRKKYQIIQM